MDKSITPSGPVTEGQIGKLCQNITVRFLKKKNELPSGAFQQVLGDASLIDEIYTLVRKRMDAINGCITRVATVYRTRTPQEVLNATGRKQYVIESVVAEMPKGEGEQIEIIFFKKRLASDNDLEKEYELRGLIPADPYSLAAINEVNPAFADRRPNATHWKDKAGKWCRATFYYWFDADRHVDICYSDNNWRGSWWFAGIRKSTSNSDASNS